MVLYGLDWRVMRRPLGVMIWYTRVRRWWRGRLRRRVCTPLCWGLGIVVKTTWRSWQGTLRSDSPTSSCRRPRLLRNPPREYRTNSPSRLRLTSSKRPGQCSRKPHTCSKSASRSSKRTPCYKRVVRRGRRRRLFPWKRMTTRGGSSNRSETNY